MKYRNGKVFGIRHSKKDTFEQLTEPELKALFEKKAERPKQRGMLAPLDATDPVNPEMSCGIARPKSTAPTLLQ